MKLQQISHIFNRVLDVCATLSAAIIIFAMLSVCVAIGMRFFLGEPMTWVIDVCSILLVYYTFLAAAWLLRIDGHVMVDLVINMLKPKQKFFLNIVTSILSSIIFMVLTWYSLKSAWAHYVAGYWMPTPLETPKWLVIGIVPIGSFLLFIQSLRKLFGYVLTYKSLSTKIPAGSKQ